MACAFGGDTLYWRPEMWLGPLSDEKMLAMIERAKGAGAPAEALADVEWLVAEVRRLREELRRGFAREDFLRKEAEKTSRIP